MNTKEMIEFLPSLKSAYFEWNVKYGKKLKLTKIKMNKHIIDEIIRLLQCGEKHKQMWEKFKGMCWHDSVKRIMNDHEQKYFPTDKTTLLAKPKEKVIK